MKWIAFLSLPLYALDQITKYWILRHVDPDSNLEIIRRWFYLVNVPNTGAAFGSFKNNNAFFIVLSLIAMVAVLSILLRKQGRPDAWRDLSLALLLAGVMGNLTDRIVHGHVTDFLLFNLHIRFANRASVQRRRFLHLHRSHLLYHSHPAPKTVHDRR
jgi:signal peptidase II